MIRIFSFNITAEEQIIINKIKQFLSPNEVISIDLRCFDPESSNQDVLILFGAKAAKICQDLSYKIKEEFPELSKLSPDFGESYEREQARNKLILLKKELASINTPKDYSLEKNKNIEILIKDLEDISSKDILDQADIVLKSKEQKAWILQTKSNKIVRITHLPEKSNADIDTTFSELYMLKIAMEVFQVKELEIVYCIKNNN